MKLQSFFTEKGTVIQAKQQDDEWEKIFTNYNLVEGKELNCIKEPQNSASIKQITKFKNGI